ncbi:MAG: hypothetical protein KAR06_06530 [Deltaproteobacteria bacterium]|nr:hypothetical protein [Deltaproteobacteria bacterium]
MNTKSALGLIAVIVFLCVLLTSIIAETQVQAGIIEKLKGQLEECHLAADVCSASLDNIRFNDRMCRRTLKNVLAEHNITDLGKYMHSHEDCDG